MHQAQIQGGGLRVRVRLLLTRLSLALSYSAMKSLFNAHTV